MTAPKSAIHSMTGTGVGSGPTELGDTAVQIRAVNGRTLAVKTRLGAECAAKPEQVVQHAIKHVTDLAAAPIAQQVVVIQQHFGLVLAVDPVGRVQILLGPEVIERDLADLLLPVASLCEARVAQCPGGREACGAHPRETKELSAIRLFGCAIHPTDPRLSIESDLTPNPQEPTTL